jgi:hypothetical protein
MAGRVIIGGALAQRPGRGGHAWVFLQYLLGFRRLGWDVLFLDRLDGEAEAEGSTSDGPWHAGRGVDQLARLMDAFGLGDDWAVCAGDGNFVGAADVRAFACSTDLLLNFNGYLRDPEVLESVGLKVYVDIDPGFGQIWRELGLFDPFNDHDRYVTVGLGVNDAECTLPPDDLVWIPTCPPVVLDEWPYAPPQTTSFTSIASWRGSMGPLEYDGRRLGLRVHEFRRFFDMPKAVSAPFRLALDIHEDERIDLSRLRDSGWALEDPADCAGDPWRYRNFIQESGAEFQIAKELYVRTRGGWFSDRSACYLATGRPVVAQDTGFSRHLPTDRGLHAFDDPEEAAEAAQTVLADPRTESRAARLVAEEHFDSDRVLARLVSQLDGAPWAASGTASPGSTECA